MSAFDINADLLRELRAARRALRQIKRASNMFSESHDISAKADRRATAALARFTNKSKGPAA